MPRTPSIDKVQHVPYTKGAIPTVSCVNTCCFHWPRVVANIRDVRHKGCSYWPRMCWARVGRSTDLVGTRMYCKFSGTPAIDRGGLLLSPLRAACHLWHAIVQGSGSVPYMLSESIRTFYDSSRASCKALQASGRLGVVVWRGLVICGCGPGAAIGSQTSPSCWLS